MDPKPDDPVLPFATAAAFDKWLAKQHAKAACVWIKYAKKGSGQPSITWTEAVDVALCYGWIDGQAKSLDEHHYLQRFTPRRATSVWSKINRDRITRLIEAGRMRPAGQAEVDRAKADGRWDAAYDSPKTAVVPDDLARALAKHPKAKTAFAKLDATNRYAILHRIMLAKQPQTRARRIETFITMLEASKLIHPPSKPAASPRAARRRALVQPTPRR